MQKDPEPSGNFSDPKEGGADTMNQEILHEKTLCDILKEEKGLMQKITYEDYIQKKHAPDNGDTLFQEAMASCCFATQHRNRLYSES